jgi:putative DNA primase/helicase
VLIDYLQKFIGHCLTGDVTEQYLHVFYGSGQNGKSVLCDTLANMLGDYAVIVPADLLVARKDSEHPTELTTLCGRRLAIASESEEGRRLRISRVKALTGDATLTARYMRGDYFSFPRTHKIVLVTNHKPKIPDDSTAIWRRVRLIPFTVEFPESAQDKGLLRKLRDEWPGILAWAVRGCAAWQREGLQAPADIQAATLDYRNEENCLVDFFGDSCVFDQAAFVGRTALFTAYEAWAANRHEKYALGRQNFYERVRQHEGVRDVQQRQGAKPIRGFAGIGLAADENIEGV